MKQVLQLEEDILTRLPKEKTHTQSPASKVPEPSAAGPAVGGVPHRAWWKVAARGLGLSTRSHPRFPEVPGLSCREFPVSHHGPSFHGVRPHRQNAPGCRGRREDGGGCVIQAANRFAYSTVSWQPARFMSNRALNVTGMRHTEGLSFYEVLYQVN